MDPKHLGLNYIIVTNNIVVILLAYSIYINKFINGCFQLCDIHQLFKAYLVIRFLNDR